VIAMVMEILTYVVYKLATVLVVLVIMIVVAPQVAGHAIALLVGVVELVMLALNLLVHQHVKVININLMMVQSLGIYSHLIVIVGVQKVNLV